MNKVIIGIAPNSKLFLDDDSFNDKYYFNNNVSKAVINSGGIALGLLGSDGTISKDIMAICDGFILPGGNKIDRSWYEIILYAIRNNKPLLGICLGSQAINIVSIVLDYFKDRNFSDEEFIKKYQEVKKDYNGTLLEPISNHYSDITRNNINTVMHKNKIMYNTYLADIYKKENISVVSLHKHKYKNIGSKFIYNCISYDNVFEGLEYKDKNYFIIGVLFHPELESNSLIFKRLINECIKRRN